MGYGKETLKQAVPLLGLVFVFPLALFALPIEILQLQSKGASLSLQTLLLLMQDPVKLRVLRDLQRPGSVPQQSEFLSPGESPLPLENSGTLVLDFSPAL